MILQQNCLKLLKENQNTNRNGQSIVFKIEEKVEKKRAKKYYNNVQTKKTL